MLTQTYEGIIINYKIYEIRILRLWYTKYIW